MPLTQQVWPKIECGFALPWWSVEAKWRGQSPTRAQIRRVATHPSADRPKLNFAFGSSPYWKECAPSLRAYVCLVWRRWLWVWAFLLVCSLLSQPIEWWKLLAFRLALWLCASLSQMSFARLAKPTSWLVWSLQSTASGSDHSIVSALYFYFLTMVFYRY